MGERISKSILYTSVLTAIDNSGEQACLGNMAKKFNCIIICLQNLTNAAERSFDEKMMITVFVTDVNQACDDPIEWRRYFTGGPDSTLVEVSQLKSPEVIVESEPVFRIPGDPD